MSYVITQGGANLYKVDLTTGVATQLTLPTGVTLSTTRKPRFAVLNQWVVMVNSPSRNLAIDPEGTVRVMIPRAPTHAPTAVAGSSTGLTGAYQFWQSFVVKNSDDELLMESPLSPISKSVTLANTDASLSDLARSLDDITARRVYRTLASGALPYWILDHEGNVGETTVNATSDATLALLPSLALTTNISTPGTMPGIRFKFIVEWKSRLWAVADDPTLADVLYASETNKIYAWPNAFVAYPTGQDAQGIVALAPRKNVMGLLKRNGVWQTSAISGGTGVAVSNLSIQQISFDTAGCVAPDSVVCVNDKVYWLGNDGIYEWSDNGIVNVSNDTVRAWFQSDTYFNRSQFSNAFARYNKLRNQYELHLASAGQTTADRWVSFNLSTKRFFGPHQTAAFVPTHASHMVDSNALPISLVGGSDGVIYLANDANYRDGAATAIDFDCYGPFHSMNSPDIKKTWLQLTMQSKIQGAGNLTVTPYVGRLNAVASAAITHDLTTGRELLRRIGDGELLRFRFRQNVVNQGVTLYGYEVPQFEIGRR
jgi:hypothetical protein